MRLNEILREGQAKTLEQMGLMEKQVAGTITADELTRLNMLNGNLLALAKEAQALGFGTQVNIPDEDTEDEDYGEYDDEDYGEYDDEDDTSEDKVCCHCGRVNCGY